MKSTQDNNSHNLIQSKLKKTEELLALAMRGTNDGLWDWDLLTNEVYYSPKWKSMLGYQDNELKNHLDTWKKLVFSEDKDIVLKKAKDFIEGKEDKFEIEMRMNHKNGSEVIIFSRAFLVKDEFSSKPIRLVGTHIDITERKKSEEFIRKTNVILEMIAVGKPASDVYDSIALMYEARHPGLRCSLLELEDGKLLHGGAPSMPKEYCDAVHGLEIGPKVGSCGTSTYTGRRVLVENIETDPKWSEIKSAALPHGMRCCWSEPIIDSRGKVLGAFGMYYDYPCLPNEEESKDLLSAARLTSIVMERDQSHKRMQYDQKLISEQSKLVSMGEMIGNIAHQWRQPLSAISTVASGIQLNEEFGISNSKNISDHMGTIITQVDYLSQTIDDFRYFIKENKSKKPVSILEVLESTFNLLDSSFSNSYISVIKTFGPDITIRGYKNELIQVFINILNNSKDAIINNNITEEDRLIFVETKKVDDSFMVEIKDTGLGIDEEIINRIFEPYFTTKDKSIGTGIGLSMSYQIVTKRHEGQISVSNIDFRYKNKKFKGACFRIFLKV